MAPTNKESGSTRMPGEHVFQAVQHPELDMLGLVAIRNFLKKRARNLRLVAQNNKAGWVNVTSIALVASIDRELLENNIDIKETRQILLMNLQTKALWNFWNPLENAMRLSQPSSSRPAKV
jgi:hypothetical protein